MNKVVFFSNTNGILSYQVFINVIKMLAQKKIIHWSFYLFILFFIKVSEVPIIFAKFENGMFPLMFI